MSPFPLVYQTISAHCLHCFTHVFLNPMKSGFYTIYCYADATFSYFWNSSNELTTKLRDFCCFSVTCLFCSIWHWWLDKCFFLLDLAFSPLLRHDATLIFFFPLPAPYLYSSGSFSSFPNSPKLSVSQDCIFILFSSYVFSLMSLTYVSFPNVVRLQVWRQICPKFCYLLEQDLAHTKSSIGDEIDEQWEHE